MLRTIKRQGFIVEEGTVFDGVTGIAAPIRDPVQRVIAALGVTFISSLEDENGIRMIREEVVRTAETISRELGWRKPDQDEKGLTDSSRQDGKEERKGRRRRIGCRGTK